MARGDFPSSRQDQFVLRFPDGMRDRLKGEADANNRSMNAEIIARLEESFDNTIFETAVSQSRTLTEQGITIERQSETLRVQRETLDLLEKQNIELREKLAYETGRIAAMEKASENLANALGHAIWAIEEAADGDLTRAKKLAKEFEQMEPKRKASE